MRALLPYDLVFAGRLLRKSPGFTLVVILATGQIEVVGICADTLYSDLHEPPPPQFFVPYFSKRRSAG